MNGIILIRHAESEKNIKDIHGGFGENLTADGRKQAAKCANLLRQYIPLKLWALPSVHTKETAKIIADELGVTYCLSPELYPLNLGVVAGLSNDEVRIKYPEVYENLSLWRNRQIEICDLKIPGMEDALAFWNRGIKMLEVLKTTELNCLICTNSVAILLINMLLGRDVIRGHGYKHISIKNGDYAVFEWNKANGYTLLTTTIGEI